MPRVLVVNPNFDDFLTDGLFHGLRRLLGVDAVDFPRIDHLYADHPPEWRRRLHGRGFTLSGLLDDPPVERNRCLARAADGEFDLVVFSDIWRTFGLWTEWAPVLAARRCRMAVIDGSDRIEPFPYAGKWWRVPAWWTLPRIEGRAFHFKREATRWSWWFASYLALPPRAAARLGRLRGLRPIAFSVPAEAIVDVPPTKHKDWPAHVVDPELARRLGATTDYAFREPDAYHRDLRASRFGVTAKREGWEALRHYEIAAAGAVPCFRDLNRKPPLCAPFGLVDGVNCIAYRHADELLKKIARLEAGDYQALQRGALQWVHANTTVERARRLPPSGGAAYSVTSDGPLDTAAELEAEEDVLEAGAAGGKVIRGGAARTLGYVGGILVGLASTPLMVRHLGVEDFGRFVTVGSLIFIVVGLTEGGLSAIGVREYATRDADGRYRLVRSLLGLRAVLAVAAIGAAVGFGLLAGYDDVLLNGILISSVGLVLSASVTCTSCH